MGDVAGYLFKRELIKDIRFDKNTSYMEDTIFIIQVLQNVEKIKTVKSAIYNYNLNQYSLTKSINNIEKRLDGYFYSLDKVSKLLNNCEFNEDIAKRKVKLLESEFAKICNKEEIEKLLENENAKQIARSKNVNLQYKLFIYLVRKKNIKGILLYVKLRNKIKKLVKRK